jgi:hypothetical protein
VGSFCKGETVIVQWCIKGLALPDDAAARGIIDSQGGIVCNWWRAVGTISPSETRAKLNDMNLNYHVNHFKVTDPATSRPFFEQTPFISLSAGTVERDTAAKTNLVHRARKTALWFGTGFGAQDAAYLFICWTILAPRPCIPIEGVAEEVRDLNAYRRYSDVQTEGEVTVKVIVPDNHIKSCEKWVWDRRICEFLLKWEYRNPRFTRPEQLSNVRELI